MSEWRVDPDRVVGVLAGVDDEGTGMVDAVGDVEAVRSEGRSALSVDGRSSVVAAWEEFFDARHLVPGKLIHVVTAAAGAVSQATVAIVAGDAEMAGSTRSAQDTALNEWGIDSANAYEVY